MKTTVPLLLVFALKAAADGWSSSDPVPSGSYNVSSALSDSTTNWGRAPPWDALDTIKDNCISLGCNTADPITYDTQVIDGPNLVDAQITMTVDADANDDGQPGSLDDLVEIAKTVVANGNYDCHRNSPYQSDTPDNCGPLDPSCDCK